jgi:hypothetical protein
MTKDFIDQIIFSLTEKKINNKQRRILKACFDEFWEFSDDPIEPPSSQICLLAASCNQKLPQALSSSINSFGEVHFPFRNVYEYIQYGTPHVGYKIPGFGHPKYKNGDPRVKRLLSLCKKIKYNSLNLLTMLETSENICLDLNFAGFLTCILIDCGCDEHNIEAFPIICRTIGLTKVYRTAKLKCIKFQSGYDVIKKYNRED